MMVMATGSDQIGVNTALGCASARRKKCTEGTSGPEGDPCVAMRRMTLDIHTPGCSDSFIRMDFSGGRDPAVGNGTVCNRKLGSLRDLVMDGKSTARGCAEPDAG
jgi:hypothetical protein